MIKQASRWDSLKPQRYQSNNELATNSKIAE